MKLQQVRRSHPSLPIVVQLIDKAGEFALRVLIAQCEVLVVIHVLYICQKSLQRNFILDVVSYDLFTVLHAVIAIPAYQHQQLCQQKAKGCFTAFKRGAFPLYMPCLSRLTYLNRC